MASESSFDCVSQFDEQELTNALDQARREISTRFDLKDTHTEITLDKQQIAIVSDSEFTMKSVRDVIESKMVRRNLSLKILKPEELENAAGGKVRQKFILQRGISQDLSREITKQIKTAFPKIRTQIQGDAIRVFGKSRDELQEVIVFLRKQEYPVALQFENYR